MMFELAILKLTSICNLNCTYCYMFNQADGTHERVVRNMPLRTALRALDRIEEHAHEHNKEVFHLTLHGGEPSLWPHASFRGLLQRVEAVRRGGLRLSVSMQTNAIRLPNRLLDLLAEHAVTLGVSLDGPKNRNDAARITHGGRGSYDRVMRTVSELVDGDYENLLQGFLSVADPSIPPDAFLQWADALPVRRLDVLWPLHFHHGNPPWGSGSVMEYAANPTYGTWFADLFDAWWERDDPTLYIRSFYDCIYTALGSDRHVESIVNDKAPIFVVNTDGCLEYHDYFRSYSDGGTRSAFNVRDDSLSSLARDPVFRFLLDLRAHHPSECIGCPYDGLCGGGFLPGRMEVGQVVPRHRSVLCLDQYAYFKRFHATFDTYLRDGPRAQEAAQPSVDPGAKPFAPLDFFSGRLPAPMH